MNNFEKKTRSINNINNNNNNNNNDNVNNNNNNNNKKKNNNDKKQTITFPWIPKIEPKIKKEIQTFAFRVAFHTGPNLKNILCKT